MTEYYFTKLPIIQYNNYQMRNISERVTMVTTPRLAPIDYFPYELGNSLRPDQLAGAYYKDATVDWLIYIVNKIVDPYYGWHLYDPDFDNYIIDKYGDLATAQQTFIFWRTNWPSDFQKIFPDSFDRLDGAFKKYFQPTWGDGNRILYYERRQDDVTMNVNKIVQYQITSNPGFANGDLLIINNGGEDVGQAQCMFANDTVVTAKNLFNDAYVGELRQRANTNIQATINNVVTISIDIPDAEVALWEPVSYYDIEREANERKRFIDLLGDTYVMPVVEQVRRELQG